MARRSYGTGSLLQRTDSKGAVNWYGQWRQGGALIKRKIGPKRLSGSRDGLNQRQAQAQLARIIPEHKAPATGDRIDIPELSRRYLRAPAKGGKPRKPSTVENVESEVGCHLAPFFAGRSVEQINADDVADLISALENKGLAPKSIRNVI